jgi:hypothetical protein
MKEIHMKIINNAFRIVIAFLLFAACSEESDLAIKRLASPVVIDVVDSNPGEITATISELDKSGIMDNTVGIKYLPVADLEIEVFSGTLSIGSFTTNTEGEVVIVYAGTKPNEYAGVYKGVAFRIKK